MRRASLVVSAVIADEWKSAGHIIPVWIWWNKILLELLHLQCTVQPFTLISLGIQLSFPEGKLLTASPDLDEWKNSVQPGRQSCSSDTWFGEESLHDLRSYIPLCPVLLLLALKNNLLTVSMLNIYLQFMILLEIFIFQSYCGFGCLYI